MKKLLLIGMGPYNGLSIAKRFGREGFEILMLARQADKLPAIVAELAALGIRSQGFAVDIADTNAYQALLRQLALEHPDLDILHYNASAYHPALPSAISLPVFMEDLQINIVGALLAAQAFLPAFRARRQGTIFLTGGGSAFQAPAQLASLGVGKAGMRNLCFSLAEECRDFQVHVATVTISGMVQPGTAFDPDFVADAFWRLYQQSEPEWETEVVMK